MKWFKHISDSLDDPFIFELIDTYGGDGYLVFFGVIEIYSREFKPELDWKLMVTQAYLKQKLHKRQATLIIKILKHIQNSGKWEIEFNGSYVVIFIPKFLKIIDEWTGKKLRSKSRQAPINLRAEVEEEVEEEVYKNSLSDPNEYRLSEYLLKYIIRNNPKAKKPNLETWAKDFDKMIRLDKRSADDIKSVIEWCQSDDFWMGNILSASKLRKQFDQLTVKMNQTNSTSGEHREHERLIKQCLAAYHEYGEADFQEACAARDINPEDIRGRL